jgi:hypothetical protein
MLLPFCLGLVGVFVLVAVDSSLRQSPGPTGRPTGGSDASLADGGGFSIHGSLTATLSPGRSEPLDLRLDNPTSKDLVVTDIDVTVAAVAAPGATVALPCTVDDFAVIAGRGELRLAAGATLSLSGGGWDEASLPRVAMTDTTLNQDGCKGATLALDYDAEGHR